MVKVSEGRRRRSDAWCPFFRVWSLACRLEFQKEQCASFVIDFSIRTRVHRASSEGGKEKPKLRFRRFLFEAIDVLALVMPSCKSGATSPSSLNTVKTKSGPEQTASSKRAGSILAGSTSSSARVTDDGSLRGHTTAGKAKPLLGCSRCVARLERSVCGGCVGAAVPRLQKLMTEAAEATTPIPNATILEDEDRAASTQLCWMVLMICKGAAPNIVFLSGDSEGLVAWRQLTEKYEPKMRTRFAGQLMSILSFSLQDDTTERIPSWERELATYESDSNKVLDDEIKIGTFLLRSPESPDDDSLAGAC